MTTNDVIKAIYDFKKEQERMKADILRLEKKIDALMILLAGQDENKIKKAIAVTEVQKVEVKEEKAPQKTNANAEEIATEYLHKIGVPANIKGYQYLKFAIAMVVNDVNTISGITKKIYPDIAKECHTTESRVERAIRHAIDVAWLRGNIEYLNEMFEYSIDPNKGRPTNSEFIAMIAERIRMDTAKK